MLPRLPPRADEFDVGQGRPLSRGAHVGPGGRGEDGGGGGTEAPRERDGAEEGGDRGEGGAAGVVLPRRAAASAAARRARWWRITPRGECRRLWRWWQTPTRVEVVVSLFEVRRELRRASRKPPSRRRKKGQRQPAVEVSIRPRGLSFSLPSGGGAADRDDENGEEKKVDLLSGTLFKKIAVDGSTWHVSDGSLFVSLLKLSRRGCYADGDTAAETWWRSMFEMEEEAGEGAEEKKKEEVKGGKDGEARPTTKTTTTTTTLASCSSPPASSFLKLPEPLPASAPLSYYALQRDPDDEGGFVVATRRRR